MDIEVVVTFENAKEVQAKLDKLFEETRRKMASGELVPGADEPEVEPCDCPGCSPHLGPEIPCTGKQTDGTGEK